MERLYNVLTNEHDQNQITQFTLEQNNNPNFGSILFQALQNNSAEIPHDNPTFLIKCCFLLKNWAKINWENMDINQKNEYFDSLKKLIISKQEAYVLNLSDAFIDIADRELRLKSNNCKIYEVHYNDFFNLLSSPQSCSMQQIIAVLHIIDFASHRYNKSEGHDYDEISFFLSKVVEVILPYLGNEQLLLSQEGCDILGLALSIFIHPFIIVKPPIENEFSIPFKFSETIEINYINHTFSNAHLLCSVVRFLNHAYKSTYKKIFRQNAINILQTNFQLLSIALEPTADNQELDYYLISKILQIIEQFKTYITPHQNIIDLLLQSAKLTPTDITNFNCNPNMFYYNVYYTVYIFDHNDPPFLSRTILSFVFSKNSHIKYKFIEYLISLPPSENVIRCLGFCINSKKIFDEEEDMEEEEEEAGNEFILPNSITPYYTELIQNPKYHQDPFMITSILDLIRYLVPFIPNEQKMYLMQILPNYFVAYHEYLIITLFCIRLLKKLIGPDIPPFENAIQFIIQSLPNSFTPDWLKCIKRMIQFWPNTVIPYVDIFLKDIFDNFNESLSKILLNADQEDMETENVESNLQSCANLISCAGPSIVKPYFLEIVKNIFENDLTDLIDDLVVFLTAVFHSGSQLIPDFMKLIIGACQQDIWKGHSGNLLRPFFELVSSNPQLFIELNMCKFLAEFCIKMLTNEITDCGNWLDFGCFLAWVIIIDGQNKNEIDQNDIQNIIQCGTTIIRIGNAKAELISSFLEILASIAVSRNIYPDESVVNLMVNSVKSNLIVRVCQKQLYIIFFLNFAIAQNNFADQFVPVAFHLINEMIIQKNTERYFDKIKIPREFHNLTFDFPFRSPIESFPLSQILFQALQFCQKEIVAKIQESYPVAFKQLVEQQSS
ncbi:hypothetical protein M9Y10_002199 [Tritrichomonas musculus]|uniref:Importin N-terminal domain-containing protein n=1 Tax=Tritrichomonas musculus TaxID=1915356 RepID=A0ABR2L942_9EUKA